jgi:hypothetical protein
MYLLFGEKLRLSYERRKSGRFWSCFWFWYFTLLE